MRILGALFGTLLAALLLVAAGPLETSTALAQDTAGEADSEAQKKARAQELYNAGLRAYNIGEFDQAIKDWKAAYQFLGVPDFLFNIAQAYRQQKNYSEAVFFYNAFLREKPDAVNSAEVTALRDEMAALVEAQESSRELPPNPDVVVDPSAEDSTETAATLGSTSTATGASSGPELVATRSDDQAGRGMRLTGMIAGGTGVAFIATGIVFALSASSSESDLEKAAANQEPWSDAFADKEKSAERSATIATVLLATGVAAIVGGGAAYYLGRKKREESQGFASLRVAPTLGHDDQGTRAGLALGGSF